MKKILMIAVMSLNFASLAHASGVACSTNPESSPIHATTSVAIQQQGNEVAATVRNFGGFAQFISQPVTFPVKAQAYGPEVVVYTDATGDWELEVGYQPIGGHINATLITETNGVRSEQALTCTTSQ